MPCDFLTCDEIVVDLRPQRIWKLRTLPLKVRNFKLFCHRTHKEEWHTESRLAAFIRWRISYADWLTSLIEPPPRWTPALWQWGFDYALAYLDFDVELVHIRIEDRRNHFAWGIKMSSWHLWSEPATLDSLWASRRHFVMHDICFYLDPHCRAREVFAGANTHAAV